MISARLQVGTFPINFCMGVSASKLTDRLSHSDGKLTLVLGSDLTVWFSLIQYSGYNLGRVLRMSSS